MFRKIISRIQNKLILLFAAFCLVIFSVSGLLHYWYTESSLDEELGRKLIAVAQAARLQIHSDFVTRLERGDELSRTYRHYRKRLIELRDATDVERIYVIDREGGSFLDTDEGVLIGYRYPFLKFNQPELEMAERGLPAHSILFETYDGKLYKTAFVPIIINNECQCIIAVEGSATFLYLIKRIEWHLITIGIVGVIVSILIGIYFSRTISNPVTKLMEEAEKIGAGKLTDAIHIRSADELGFLGATMERMRKNILKRDQHMLAMLAGVAHELRNPLAGVEIFAHLLKKEKPNDDALQDKVMKIIRETEVMKRILGDFVDFARPRKPQPEVCNVERLLEEVHSIFHSELDSKNIILVREIGPNRVFADPGQVRQCLMNLIENAQQSISKDGTIRISTSVRERDIEISIEDTGEGVAESIRDKIFDPFFTTKERGSGLGLAIVKKLVDENNGDVRLESEADQGAKFVISFPRSEI